MIRIKENTPASRKAPPLKTGSGPIVTPMFAAKARKSPVKRPKAPVDPKECPTCKRPFLSRMTPAERAERNRALVAERQRRHRERERAKA